jgi:FKBP-type peptidyl-prolyl cis-trans isomerase
MKVGGRRKLTIPPDLAYGDRAMGGKIPPKSTLNFDIELISIQ